MPRLGPAVKRTRESLGGRFSDLHRLHLFDRFAEEARQAGGWRGRERDTIHDGNLTQLRELAALLLEAADQCPLRDRPSIRAAGGCEAADRSG